MKLVVAAPLAALVFAAPAFAQEFKPYSKPAFEQLMRSGQPVLVHVHADWCPTCKRQVNVLGPILADPASAGLQAVRVDFDKEVAFKRENRVTGQSTLIVYKGGREIGRSVGATDPATISALIAQVR